MPSSSSVHEQLTDIVVRVVGCPAEAVVPGASLKKLGTDSLTIVELAEELGRRFDVYLDDDTVDGLVTVQDAIDAIVRSDSAAAPSRGGRVTATSQSPAPPRRGEDERRRRLAHRMAFWFVAVGAAVGALLGFAGSALIEAVGIGSVDLPAIGKPTTTPSTAPATTPAPEPTEPTPSQSAAPEPTIKVSKPQVAPGERFVIEGTFPAAGAGAELQIQVKDEGSEWDDFPIETTTRSGGKFKTEIYTSRTGERQFRLRNEKTDKSTPAVTVQIG